MDQEDNTYSDSDHFNNADVHINEVKGTLKGLA
jgi:hypothetical protein